MYRTLAQWCYRHRGTVIGVWLALIVGLNAAGGLAGAAFNGEFASTGSESDRGFAIVQEFFPGAGSAFGGQIVFQRDSGVTGTDVEEPMTALFAKVDAIDGVNLVSPFTPFGAEQISDDGTIAFAQINLDPDIDDTEATAIGVEIDELVPEVDGLRVELGGAALGEFEPPESELIGLAFAIVVLIVSFGSVLAMGLPIGIAVAGVGAGGFGLVTLLTHVFQIPDFAPLIGIMIGLGVGIDYALFIVTRYRELTHAGAGSEQATVGAMDTAGRAVVFAGITVVLSLLGMLLIGLPFIAGLGIAAAATVFVTLLASLTLLPALLALAGDKIEVTRWRGLIAAGFAALALLGLGLSVPMIAAVGGFGLVVTLAVGTRVAPLVVAAALVAVILGIVSTWLALIGVAGAVAAFVLGMNFSPLRHVTGFQRIGPLVTPLARIVPPRAEKPIRETWAYRWSRIVQARPWMWVALSGGVLLVLTAPVLSLRLGFSDEGNFSEDTTTRQAYDLIAEGFGPGFNGPFLLAAEIDDPGDLATIQQLSATIAADPGVQSVSDPFPNNLDPAAGEFDPAATEALIVRIIPTTAPQDAETEDTVARLRDTVIAPAVAGTGIDANLTGAVPANIDFSDFLGGRIIVFFGAVLAVSFLLLMMVFRSLLVPLKAVIMNMLSISAAYGVVVAIFQWGWFGGFTGIEPAPIEPFVPMMLFAIVFGLSMDYEVFLLSRVKEEYDRTGDPVISVADGLAATARVITAAAAIMVVVFGAFLLEDNRIVKLFGTGLALAVFLDATLVRMLLVPATMELLGSKNWWLPKWLDRILPTLNIEGHALEALHADIQNSANEPDRQPIDA